MQLSASDKRQRFVSTKLKKELQLLLQLFHSLCGMDGR
jgi:hypothetical protein